MFPPPLFPSVREDAVMPMHLVSRTREIIRFHESSSPQALRDSNILACGTGFRLVSEHIFFSASEGTREFIFSLHKTSRTFAISSKDV